MRDDGWAGDDRMREMAEARVSVTGVDKTWARAQRGGVSVHGRSGNRIALGGPGVLGSPGGAAAAIRAVAGVPWEGEVPWPREAAVRSQ
jgi:hypothetical protein